MEDVEGGDVGQDSLRLNNSGDIIEQYLLMPSSVQKIFTLEMLRWGASWKSNGTEVNSCFDYFGYYCPPPPISGA